MSTIAPNGDDLVLAGSERAPVADAQECAPPLGAAPQIEATVILRRRRPIPDSAFANPWDRREFEHEFGADPAEVDAVVAAFGEAGVEVVETDPAARRVRIRGDADELAALFGSRLAWVSAPDADGNRATFRQRTGWLTLPSALQRHVVAVLGLDGRPAAHTGIRTVAPEEVARSYTPPELGRVYRFPPDTDGSGGVIAIIELGGGYGAADLDAYFGALGMAVPGIVAVGVDGAVNTPGQAPQGADGEVLLDIEDAGSLAPGADFVVYFAPNTDAGFVDAVSRAAHADPTPVAMSISWGQSEDEWTAQARNALDAALADAAAMGVTVTVAAGDHGSSDAEAGRLAHVDFPASSPHVLACGGTTLTADPATGTVASETVWNNLPSGGATGGGVSDVFPLPVWQQAVGVPGSGRGVPDVAADADPHTGYQVRIDGTDTVIGGTSAVAPLWAALIARLAQQRGRRLGLAQPGLYTSVGAGAPAPGFRDITQGSNGAYSAGPGWDACTGLGTPIGSELSGR